MIPKKNSTHRLKREIRHFTNLDHIWWGAKTAAGQARYDNKAELLVRMCKPEKDTKILEVGCGDGEFTRRLLLTRAKIIATDVTPEVVRKGRRAPHSKNIKFYVENAEKLSFKDKTFDIVCGVSLLHHVDTETALREAYRVLKAGGQLFFTEPNLLNPHILLGLYGPSLRKRMEFSPDETALVRWKLEKMLKRIGFRNSLVRNYDFLHPKTPAIAINFMEGVSSVLEKIPLVKEISGSLLVYAVK